MRRLVLLVPVCLAASAVVASAFGPSAAKSSRALRLPDLDRCVVGASIRVGLVPPAGTDFASLSVRVGEREVLQLADLAGPGSVLVPLRRPPGGSVLVRATATTSDGEFISAKRRYRRCRTGEDPTPEPARRPRPETPGVGGGEG